MNAENEHVHAESFMPHCLQHEEHIVVFTGTLLVAESWRGVTYLKYFSTGFPGS